jgi:hypothetical protein
LPPDASLKSLNDPSRTTPLASTSITFEVETDARETLFLAEVDFNVMKQLRPWGIEAIGFYAP